MCPPAVRPLIISRTCRQPAARTTPGHEASTASCCNAPQLHRNSCSCGRQNASVRQLEAWRAGNNGGTAEHSLFQCHRTSSRPPSSSSRIHWRRQGAQRHLDGTWPWPAPPIALQRRHGWLLRAERWLPGRFPARPPLPRRRFCRCAASARAMLRKRVVLPLSGSPIKSTPVSLCSSRLRSSSGKVIHFRRAMRRLTEWSCCKTAPCVGCRKRPAKTCPAAIWQGDIPSATSRLMGVDRAVAEREENLHPSAAGSTRFRRAPGRRPTCRERRKWSSAPDSPLAAESHGPALPVRTGSSASGRESQLGRADLRGNTRPFLFPLSGRFWIFSPLVLTVWRQACI